MRLTLPGRQTLTASLTLHHLLERQTQKCLQFIDLTDEIRAFVRTAGITQGTVNVQTRHTTTAIIINENEPLLLEDLRRTLERLAPRRATYQHDDFDIRTVNLTPEEKPNGHAHCKALLLRTSEMLNIVDGDMMLGQWQRIFLIELDCARLRTVSILVTGQTME